MLNYFFENACNIYILYNPLCAHRNKETKEKIALLDFLAGISLCHELYLIQTRSNPTDSSIAATIIIIYDQWK